jgi:hypothetical protein
MNVLVMLDISMMDLKFAHNVTPDTVKNVLDLPNTVLYVLMEE